MDSLYLLIPIAIVFVIVAVFVFFWAVKSGQFDDLDAEGKRILFDDAKKSEKATAQSSLESERNE